MFSKILKAKRARRKQRGAAQIEFAISVMLILILMFWIWEILMGMYTASVLADAAKEGVRYAIVHGSTSTLCSGPNASSPCANDAAADKVKSAVRDYAKTSFHDISAMTVAVSYPDTTNDPPNRVEVVVTYTYVPFIRLTGMSPVLTTKAAGRIVF